MMNQRTIRTESPTYIPAQEEIRERAFAVYVRRGRGPGKENEDWAQAERELREEHARRR